MVAGFAKAKEFHAYREAAIAEKYNLDEVSQRILNADGASWIRKVKDKSTCFQLDPFHRNKAVKEKIHNRQAADDIMELLEEGKIDELFGYLELYKNSLWEEGEIKDTEELIRYYKSKRGGNHLAKILAKKCSGKLYEVTEKLKVPVFEEEQVEELYREILTAAKAPKKDGKGYEYPAIGHVVGLEGRIRGDRKKLLAMSGY